MPMEGADQISYGRQENFTLFFSVVQKLALFSRLRYIARFCSCCLTFCLEVVLVVFISLAILFTCATFHANTKNFSVNGDDNGIFNWGRPIFSCLVGCRNVVFHRCDFFQIKHFDLLLVFERFIACVFFQIFLFMCPIGRLCVRLEPCGRHSKTCSMVILLLT